LSRERKQGKQKEKNMSVPNEQDTQKEAGATAEIKGPNWVCLVFTGTEDVQVGKQKGKKKVKLEQGAKPRGQYHGTLGNLEQQIKKEVIRGLWGQVGAEWEKRKGKEKKPETAGLSWERSPCMTINNPPPWGRTNVRRMDPKKGWGNKKPLNGSVGAKRVRGKKKGSKKKIKKEAV